MIMGKHAQLVLRGMRCACGSWDPVLLDTNASADSHSGAPQPPVVNAQIPQQMSMTNGQERSGVDAMTHGADERGANGGEGEEARLEKIDLEGFGCGAVEVSGDLGFVTPGFVTPRGPASIDAPVFHKSAHSTGVSVCARMCVHLCVSVHVVCLCVCVPSLHVCACVCAFVLISPVLVCT
jgi:hypothetical protein